MIEPRIWLIRLAAASVAAAVAAGCATPAATTASSLPDEQIVNDPGVIAFPDETEAPPLPLPVIQAPMHDELPPEPVVYGDVLVRIRNNLSLPQAEHPRVQREIEWLQRNPDYVARVFGRAQRYLHHITDEVEARGMPGLKQ